MTEIKSNQADYVAIQSFCQVLKQAFSRLSERAFCVNLESAVA